MVAPALLVEVEALGPERAPPVLRGVRLAIAPGERVALLGGNGAGKTTLLRAAMGLVPVGDGRVEIHGRPVRRPADAVGAGAGILFQDPADQLLAPTVLEDALIGPRHAGVPLELVRRRADEALAAVGISGLAGRAVEALSTGEQKRAGLAGVLALRPSLLLLDEPTAGLDPAGELAVARLLAEVARGTGAALLAATHAVDVAPIFAGRAVVLGEGRVLADGPLRDVLGDPALLSRAGLRPPWIAQAWAALRGSGPVPLTLEEALSWNTPRS
jgi:cobalt/nickel transport system ATP-binding protein